MHAFVANCTIQSHIVNVRLPGMSGVMNVPVEGGTQVRFPKDMSVQDIEALLKQMHVYGMYTVEEALNYKPDRQIVFLLNSEKPVPQKLMIDTYNLNRGILTNQGVEMRRVALLAARKNMMDQAHTPLAADRLEMSIEEAPGKGQTSIESMYAEGHRVTTAVPARSRRRRG